MIFVSNIHEQKLGMTEMQLNTIKVVQPTSEVVQLNVGGTVFVTTNTTLKAVPDTKLARLSTSSPEYIKELNTYFFDRNPEFFNHILDYYRTGELHLPKHVCGASIRSELEYWLVAPGSIADCCVSSLFKYEDEIDLTNNLKAQFESNGLEYTKEELASSKWNRVKNIIWCLLDKPNSSTAARRISVIYLLFVVLTVIIFILGSHRVFRQRFNEVVVINSTYSLSLYDFMMLEHENPKLAMWGATELVPVLRYVNYVCSVFFIVELILRIFSCPIRKLFFRNWLNVVDLIIVISIVLANVLFFVGSFKENTTMLYCYCTARAMIMLRLIRLFRLSRHYSGLKVLYLALKASFEELGLLLLTFLIATSLFGGLIYYAEFFHAEAFDNVPIGIWWSIVTLTTVGYGDYYPVTVSGYVIGALCAMCGLLLLSMPIAIIATNFNDYYTRNKVREKQQKRKQEIIDKMRNLFRKNNAVHSLNVPSGPATSRSANNFTTSNKKMTNGSVGHKMNGKKRGDDGSLLIDLEDVELDKPTPRRPKQASERARAIFRRMVETYMERKRQERGRQRLN